MSPLHSAKFSESMRLAVGALVPIVETTANVDSVIFSAKVAPGEPASVFGKRVREFALATGHRWPPIRQTSCDEVARAPVAGAPPARVLFVRVSTMCPEPSHGQLLDSLRYVYRHVDWTTGRIAPDSVRVDVVRPSVN